MAQIDNIIAALFLAEAHYDLPLRLEKLLSLYGTEPDRQALQIFINWFLPYVCLRVPTGGGKTLLACHAVGIAMHELLQAFQLFLNDPSALT